jgi:hypothetical protein
VYSNFITPPDFVDDQLHTVTVVDATSEEIEILGRMCQGSDEMFNIYLYRSEMNDTNWLKQAIDRSDAVIVNADTHNSYVETLCAQEKTFYYGANTFISKANKIETPIQYFAARYHQQNK